MTALGPQIIFDCLCTKDGVLNRDVDFDTLSNKLRELQEQSKLYDQLLEQLKTIFKNHQDQKAEVLKKLEASWEVMVRHHDAGGLRVLQFMKEKLDEVGVIGSDRKGKEYAEELSNYLDKEVITRFVRDVQDDAMKKQRSGVKNYNAGPGKSVIPTAEFHGYRRDEFERAIKKEVNSFTMQTALLLSEEVDYIRYRAPSASGRPGLVKLEKTDNVSPDSIVAVGFCGKTTGMSLGVRVYCQAVFPRKQGNIEVTLGDAATRAMMAALIIATPPVDISGFESTGTEYPFRPQDVEITDDKGQPVKLCALQMAFVCAEMLGIEVAGGLALTNAPALMELAKSTVVKLNHNITMGPTSSSPKV